MTSYYDTGSLILVTPDTPQVAVKSSSRLKAFAWAFVTSLFSTLGVLQFELYPWFPTMPSAFLSHFTHVLAGLPLWITVSRFDGRTLTIVKTDRGYLYLAIVCFLSMLEKQLMFRALTYIPSTVAYITQSSGPFFAMILSRIFFQERLTVLKGVAFLITATSVILMGFFKKSDGYDDVGRNLALGISLALAWSLSMAMISIAMKKISKLDAFFVILAHGLFGTVVTGGLLATSPSFEMPACGIWGMVIVLCDLSFIISGFGFYYSSKFGDPGRQSAYILAMYIVFSFMWEMVFFGRVSGLLEYVAVFLALIGTALNGFEKRISKFVTKQINKLV